MEPHVYLARLILDLRRAILWFGLAVAAVTSGFFLISPQIFTLLQQYLNQKLVFYTVAEPFLSHVKLSLALAIFTLMPAFLFFLWKALGKAFALTIKTQGLFVLFTTLLFYGGAGFCFFITLPYGIRFLLGFETTELKALISVGKCVSFITLFILAFGIIFELPIFMIFTAKVGLVGRQVYEKNRRYALLAICVIAALLTPTPDIFNMALMGLPLYLLYESGILAMRFLRL